MIVKELLEPKNIVVVGASNDYSKPGGKVLKCILSAGFTGEIYGVNPKESSVQGVKCYATVAELPNVDLAIIAIASKFAMETIEILAHQKNTKAFIILSAGFSEIGIEGKELEDRVVALIDSVGGSLIGPNCIGMLTPHYAGVFAGPIPKLDKHGIDFVSSSGGTAAFILESTMSLGLTYSSLYSVGNCAQIGVEDVLKHWDETFDPENSSRVKMLYIEQVGNPQMLLKHASSLIQKGCHVLAVKSGTTEAGSRAVSSHTGALAGSDTAVEALFKKAGIVRCFSKLELGYTAAVLMSKQLKGNRIAVITHAGGPGVLLTDALSKNKMEVPAFKGNEADELLSKLNFGSSVANPIDFLPTGTAEHLELILDYVDNNDSVDGAVVIYGTPGLFDVTPVYVKLDEIMKRAKKPIFPVLPSPVEAKDAVEHFLSLGRFYFPDEVILADTLAKVYYTQKPEINPVYPTIDKQKVRAVIDKASAGYISPDEIQQLLDIAGIPRVPEFTTSDKTSAIAHADSLGFPIVMKVIGPVHKTEVGGVALGLASKEEVSETFDRMMSIQDAIGVLIQPMISGPEVFLGAKYEDKYGHLILCGLGGIFVEVLKDVQVGLAPISKAEALGMIGGIKAHDLIKGARGKQGISEDVFADIITRLSALVELAPEIKELDINPLLGIGEKIYAVDARIRIEK
jgi:acetyltransferase